MCLLPTSSSLFWLYIIYLFIIFLVLQCDCLQEACSFLCQEQQPPFHSTHILHQQLFLSKQDTVGNKRKQNKQNV